MKVSIITATFNAQSHLQDTIDSVSRQTYNDIEYIIIDGKSTDKTIDIINKNNGLVDFFLSEKDSGYYDAVNKGISKATGEIVGILNSDDFYLNDRIISEVVKVFQENANIQVVMGNVDFVNPGEVKRPIRQFSSSTFAPWKMYFGFMPAHPATFVRSSAYQQIGLYRLNYKIAADFEWFVRAFLAHSLNYTKINKTFVRMRLGGISTSGLMSNWISTKELHNALKSNQKNAYGAVLLRLPIKFLNYLFFRIKQSLR